MTFFILAGIAQLAEHRYQRSIWVQIPFPAQRASAMPRPINVWIKGPCQSHKTMPPRHGNVLETNSGVFETVAVIAA